MGEQYKLNLGQFNQCIEYLPTGSMGEYPIDLNTKVLYYMSDEGDIASTSLAKHSICIPTFDIGVATSYGDVDDSRTIQTLLALIELRIMAMVKRIVHECSGTFKLDNVRILVKNIQFFDDDKSEGCYGWADVGIAIMVPVVETVTQ